MKRNSDFPVMRDGDSRRDLEGKRVAIVGGTGGIGRALSRHMAANGARVVVVGQTFRDVGIEGIEFIKADLSLMREARRVARLLPAEALDLLIFTTGIFAAPQRQETAEGLERDMAVSYLSRLLILREVAERLGKNSSQKPRVVIMGYPSSGRAGTLGDLNAEQSYKALDVHMNTVAGNEILVLDAAGRYPHIGVFGLNPGLIKTNIRANLLGDNRFLFGLIEGLIGLLSPTAERYAERIAPLLISPDLDHHSGALFDRKGRALLPSPGIADKRHIQAFLDQSEVLIARATALAKPDSFATTIEE